MRFSLRWLLILITLCCVGFAWWASSAKRQGEATRRLRELGARFEYGETEGGENTRLTAGGRIVSAFPWVDQNLFMSVTKVNSRYLEEPSLRRGAQYTPKTILETLPGLPRLQSLRLTHCEIQNEDLDGLAHLSRLVDLDLSMTRLHEGPIGGLEGLNLQSLDLARTRADDATLKSIVHLKSLQSLDLTRTKVTGEGLEYLDMLPKLERLLLRRCLVTRSEFEQFQRRHPKMKIRWQPLSSEQNK